MWRPGTDSGRRKSDFRVVIRDGGTHKVTSTVNKKLLNHKKLNQRLSITGYPVDKTLLWKEDKVSDDTMCRYLRFVKAIPYKSHRPVLCIRLRVWHRKNLRVKKSKNLDMRYAKFRVVRR